MPKRPAAPAPERLVELDFGDAEFLVDRYPDGMHAIVIDGERRLLLDAVQFAVFWRTVAALGDARR